MRRYLVIYEKGPDGFSAYVPDLPGCTSAGETKKEVEQNIVEAITLHLEVMEEAGLEIPEATSESEMLVFSWKMKYKEVVKMIEDDVWVQVRQKGNSRELFI